MNSKRRDFTKEKSIKYKNEKLKKSKNNRNSLKDKLYKSFIFISILGIIANLVALIFLYRTNSQYKFALNTYGLSQGEIGKLSTEIQNSKSIIRDIIYLNHSDNAIVEQRNLNESISRAEEYLDNIRNYDLPKENKELMDSISGNLKKYEKVKKDVIYLSYADKSDAALEKFTDEGNPIMEEITDSVSKLLDSNIENSNIMVEKLQKLQILAFISILAAIILCFIFSINFAKKITNSISEPIEELKNVAKSMSEGNLEINIDISSYDEIGELAKSFSKMLVILKSYILNISTILGSISKGNLNIKINEEYKGDFLEIKNSLNNILDSLNEVFNEILEASNQVTGGSQQIASTAQVLSQGANNQANSVQDLLESLHQINNNVKENTDNATKTNLITNELILNVESGNNQMKEMLNAINNIEKASKDINKINNAINDIAEQTNLLSLNAAIEAARAGEAGKGFSVVAEEVGNLASKSTNAVKQTNNLINESIKAVDIGKKLAINTEEALNIIVNSVEQSAELVSYIAMASENEANSINEINFVIEEIANVVQSNSALAEESAAASEELTAQAENLNSMINKFELRK